MKNENQINEKWIDKNKIEVQSFGDWAWQKGGGWAGENVM